MCLTNYSTNYDVVNRKIQEKILVKMLNYAEGSVAPTKLKRLYAKHFHVKEELA